MSLLKHDITSNGKFYFLFYMLILMLKNIFYFKFQIYLDKEYNLKEKKFFLFAYHESFLFNILDRLCRTK
jgi:hypothetical protein